MRAVRMGRRWLPDECVPARQLLDDTLAAADAWRARNGVAIVLDLPEEPAYLATDPLVARRVLLTR